MSGPDRDSDAATDPSLLISLGVQKSGTTWLWNYLEQHPQCAVTPLKEVHFFTGGAKHLARVLAEVEQKLREAEPPEELWIMRRFLRHAIEVRGRPGRTAEDFAELVFSVATPEARVVAEFTPANGQLKARELRALADLSVAPKFVMILRDPVDRLWSQIRMIAAQNHQDPVDVRRAAKDLVGRFLESRSGAISPRHDYRGMLRRAQNAIPADRQFVDFFETFRSQDRVDAFCDFLGIDHVPARLDEPLLVGASVELERGDRVRLREALLDQYQAVERRLGELPKRWYETLEA